MANTLAGHQIAICATPQPTDLDKAGFEALTWVDITSVGQFGQTGTETNLLNYDTLDTDVSQMAKGVSNAGQTTIQVARVHDDAGQILLNTAGDTNFQYAIRHIKNDAPDVLNTNTIHYYRGLIVGPVRPNGGVEDFDLEEFTLASNQKELTAPPELI